MTAPHLQQVDLNLLVALEALLRERHVTRAAEAIGMTQSGMSRALSRLRVQFDDPLLVKGRGGLRPTPRAEGLAAPLSRALGEVRGMMQAQSFDPALATGALRIGMPDHLALLFAPHLLALMRERAPALELLVRAFSADWQRELRDGEVDLTFGVLRGNEAHLRSRALLSDPWVVLLRDGHPALKRRWTPEAFAALEHGLMTVRGTGPSHVDRALARHGLTRRVVYRGSSPLVVAMAACDTDLAVTTSRLLARSLATRLPLRVRALPLQVETLKLPLVWHERHQHDERHRFFRGLVAECARAVS